MGAPGAARNSPGTSGASSLRSSRDCLGTRPLLGAAVSRAAGRRRALWAAPGLGHGQRELGAQGARRVRAAGALSQTKAQELRLLSGAGRWAPTLRDPAARGSGPAPSRGPAPRARTCPCPLLLALGNLPRGPERLQQGPRARSPPRARRAGARERRKFSSRARGPGTRQQRSPACSAPDQTRSREHGQLPERVRTAERRGQPPRRSGGSCTAPAAAAATGASGLPGPRRSRRGRRNPRRGKDPRPAPLLEDGEGSHARSRGPGGGRAETSIRLGIDGEKGPGRKRSCPAAPPELALIPNPGGHRACAFPGHCSAPACVPEPLPPTPSFSFPPRLPIPREPDWRALYKWGGGCWGCLGRSRSWTELLLR